MHADANERLHTCCKMLMRSTFRGSRDDQKNQKSTPEKMQTKMSLCQEPSMSLIIILITTKTRKVPRRCVSVFSDFFQRLCTCFVLQIVKAATETECRVFTVCTHARDPILRHVLTVWVQQHSLLSRARLVCMHEYCVHALVPRIGKKNSHRFVNFAVQIIKSS